MPKRFTETEKWKDKWFRSLRAEHKLAWLYLLDNCDHAGVIEIDEELADFQIGTAIDWNEFFAICNGRVDQLANGKRFIVKFIEYQYGKLSGECRPHLPVIQRLKQHGIDIESVRQKEAYRHGNVSEKRRLEVCDRDGFVCCYCGLQFDLELLQPDHLLPKSRGGTDSKDNLVAACTRCNAQKSDKDFSYFVSSLPNQEEVWQRVKQRVSERVFNSLKEKEQDQEQEKDQEQDTLNKKVRLDEWVVPENLDTPEIRELLGRFEKMRIKIKKPIKDRGNTSLVLKRFDDADHLAFALETCIANEYQGLKPDYRPPVARNGKVKVLDKELFRS